MKTPKKYDAKLTTSTLAGIDCMVTLATNADKVYKEKSTVNEKMAINHANLPSPTERQTLNVLMIGNGGHRNVALDGIDIPRPIRHQPTDVSLYSAVPFAARPFSNDFNALEKQKYCLRKLEEWKGQRYWMYYGMPVNVRGKSTGYYQVSVINGNKTVTEFEYTDLNVRPTRPEIPNFDSYDSKDEIVVPANGTYVTANIVYDIPFDEHAVQEYMNVCKILYGDPGAAIISEFSLCYSVMKEINVDTAGSLDTMMTEALGVQSGIFVSTFNNVAMDNGGLIWAVQVGQSTPLATASKDVAVNRQSGF